MRRGSRRSSNADFKEVVAGIATSAVTVRPSWCSPIGRSDIREVMRRRERQPLSTDERLGYRRLNSTGRYSPRQICRSAFADAVATVAGSAGARQSLFEMLVGVVVAFFVVALVVVVVASEDFQAWWSDRYWRRKK